MSFGGLDTDQRKALAEFCGNFAVAWLAAGVIVPLLTPSSAENSLQNIILSLFWAIVLLIGMLSLVKRKK